MVFVVLETGIRWISTENVYPHNCSVVGTADLKMLVTAVFCLVHCHFVHFLFEAP